MASRNVFSNSFDEYGLEQGQIIDEDMAFRMGLWNNSVWVPFAVGPYNPEVNHEVASSQYPMAYWPYPRGGEVHPRGSNGTPQYGYPRQVSRSSGPSPHGPTQDSWYGISQPDSQMAGLNRSFQASGYRSNPIVSPTGDYAPLGNGSRVNSNLVE